MPSHRRTLAPANLPDPPSEGSEKRLLLRAELRCYLCGGTCVELEAPHARTFPPVAQGRQPGAEQRSLIAWKGLRCQRCGGPTFLDEVETVWQRTDHVNWHLDAPRRGRPPRWLVAMRASDAA